MESCGTCRNVVRLEKDIYICAALPPQVVGGGNQEGRLGNAKVRYRYAAYPEVKSGWPPCGMYAPYGVPRTGRV